MAKKRKALAAISANEKKPKNKKTGKVPALRRSPRLSSMTAHNIAANGKAVAPSLVTPAGSTVMQIESMPSNGHYNMGVSRDKKSKLPPDLYDKIKKLWPKKLLRFLEPPEALQIADRYHQFSIPSDGKVNLLVLGESHSRTTSDVLGRRVLDKYSDLLPDDLDLGYINLVHCLTYGEVWMALEGKEYAQFEKSGTPVWWKVLMTLAGKVDVQPDGHDPLGGSDQDAWTKPFQEKVCGGGGARSKKRKQQVKNKAEILQDLRKQHIAVLDTSPVAIFLASGTKTVTNKETGEKYKTPKVSLPDDVYKKIMKECWDSYMYPLIQELKPKNIVVLGEGHGKAIGLDVLKNLEMEIGAPVSVVTHPSSRTYQQSKYMPFLRELRDISKAAARQD